MAFGDDAAFGDVFGEANAAAQHLYDYAMEDAPGSVGADISGRIARKMGTEAPRRSSDP
jgi:hypothetical protein